LIIADCHLHSDFSSDSEAPMEQMIEKAIALGLKKICLTDHIDYDYPPRGGYDFMFDIDEYINKLNELKKRYQNQIMILTGIELGLQPHLNDQINSLVNAYPFDFIIGSSHIVDHLDPYFPEYWMDKSPEEGIRKYYQTIIDNCKAIDGFHVYGHIDYIIRYIPKKYEASFQYSYYDFKEQLDHVLKTIIDSGKGIEVNTSGYKYGFSHPHPETKILKRYRELGGELITIGSDAHKPEHLCYDFELVPELLKELGFRYYAIFHQGKPIYEKL